LVQKNENGVATRAVKKFDNTYNCFYRILACDR